MDDSTITQLYQYLNEEMQADEKAEFEQRIQEDKHLAQEVEFHKDLLLGVEWVGDEDLKQKIQHAAETMEKEGFFEEGGGIMSSDRAPKTAASPRIRSLFRPQYMAIAASLLIMLIIGFFLNRSSNPYQKVYANNYSPSSTLLQEQLQDLNKSGMATPDLDRRASLLEALKYFEAGEYSTASPALQHHVEQFPSDDLAFLFLGQSLMEEQKFREATIALETNADDPTAPFHRQAIWYVGLAYLQMEGHEQKAIEAFEEISTDGGSPYRAQAIEILKEIAPEQ